MNDHPKNSAAASLKEFNATIETWIGHLDDYTLEMLGQRPDTESWSLGQVYIHIIADTRFFIEQTRAALLNNANHEEVMHNDAKAIFRNREFPDIRLQKTRIDDQLFPHHRLNTH